MAISNGAIADARHALSSIDHARAAIEAIDVGLHVDRQAAVKSSIAAKEAALKEAQDRFGKLGQLIRERATPNGDAVADALLSGSDLPKPPDDLVREKDMLAAGIGALNRQIREAYQDNRTPWDELKREVGQAVAPIVHDLVARAQSAITELEQVFAVAEVLRRVGGDGQNDGVWQLCGTMLVAARELPRRFEYQAEILLDPEITALKHLEAMQAMRAHIPSSVAAPSGVQFR